MKEYQRTSKKSLLLRMILASKQREEDRRREENEKAENTNTRHVTFSLIIHHVIHRSTIHYGR